MNLWQQPGACSPTPAVMRPVFLPRTRSSMAASKLCKVALGCLSTYRPCVVPLRGVYTLNTLPRRRGGKTVLFRKKRVNCPARLPSESARVIVATHLCSFSSPWCVETAETQRLRSHSSASEGGTGDSGASVCRFHSECGSPLHSSTDAPSTEARFLFWHPFSEETSPSIGFSTNGKETGLFAADQQRPTQHTVSLAGAIVGYSRLLRRSLPSTKSPQFSQEARVSSRSVQRHSVIEGVSRFQGSAPRAVRNGSFFGQRCFTTDVSLHKAASEKGKILLEGAARLAGKDSGNPATWSLPPTAPGSLSRREADASLSHVTGEPKALIDRNSFYSLEEMRKENRRGTPVDFRQYMRSLLLPIRFWDASAPNASRPTPEKPSSSFSLSYSRLLPPITFKKYNEGMHAAHHYPSRLLPPSQSAPLPPNVLVTPFTPHSGQGLREASLAKHAGVNTGITRKAGQPLSANKDLSGKAHQPQLPVPLTERCADRLTLLFIFTDQPPHSELKDLTKWHRDLEGHPEYSALVYPGASRTHSSQTSRAGEPTADGSNRSSAMYLDLKRNTRATSRAAFLNEDLYQVAYLCSESSTYFLRWLTLRSMRHIARHFGPQMDRHAMVDNNSISLNGCAPSLWGAFLGHAGEGGRKIIEATGLSFRPEMVTTMLIDRAGRVRWHAVGAPTDEAVQLLIDAMKALRREVPGGVRSRTRLNL
uniref:Uncharacterized protein n=1 Tax=Toxoplasma gondii COUG TaxID=1074873 RepID=A0A2G8Y7K1_TOXGO|nr:hypothetical protein TGCOUG_231460 [Toxoplasma gondii COUG]